MCSEDALSLPMANYTRHDERQDEIRKAAVKPKSKVNREVCRVCGAPADIIAFEDRRKAYYCGTHTPRAAWKT
jgi:hypothetical protein